MSRRSRKAEWPRVVALAAALLSLAGCLAVPVPSKATAPRLTETQLASLVPGSTTRDAGGALVRPASRWTVARLLTLGTCCFLNSMRRAC
jgi:hypothetical protein